MLGAVRRNLRRPGHLGAKSASETGEAGALARRAISAWEPPQGRAGGPNVRLVAGKARGVLGREAPVTNMSPVAARTLGRQQPFRHRLLVR